MSSASLKDILTKSKCVSRIKKPNKADIYAGKLQSKSTIGVRTNSEHKAALPVEDFQNHLDRLYQVQKNTNKGDSLARSYIFIRLLSN